MASSSRRVEDVIRGQEEKKTRGTKRSAVQLLPAPTDAKKKKTLKTSATTEAITHERVLRNVYSPQLLRLLGEFLCRRCTRIKDLSPDDPPTWLRDVDELYILVRGYHRRIICPGIVVFLYMLCRDAVSAEVASTEELRAVLLTCLYVTCSYIGHALSYTTFPFMVEVDRHAFWKRTLDISQRLSQQMMKINTSPQFFAQVFSDLKKRTDR
ncbi:cyclin-dependent kinase 5 activator 1-like [Salminus brasiliensis]|uniref:cyclin-dependent kinase 5 activator 1-like n=1 Tax=Salminus brasiliensis TaxID=930266 RepID=UPI003B837A0E